MEETSRRTLSLRAWGQRLLGGVRLSLEYVLRSLFLTGHTRREKWVHWVWIGALYLLGLVGWAYILNWGDFPLDFHDWAEGMGHRLAFLQQAVRTGALPLHMPDGSALRNVTDRFISTPDAIISPQVVLLRWLGLSQFVLANTLILYTVGFVGLVLIKRRARLSAFAFTPMFLLFTFNGHIKDHVSVGHMHWVGYFLLPYYFLHLFRLMDDRPSNPWAWILGVGLTLAAMFLQGAFHLFVMSLVFLGLIALVVPHHTLRLLGAMVFSVLLSLYRILPPALEIGKFDSAFLSGFVSVSDLLAALTTIRLPFRPSVFSESPLQPLGWWEYDHYVGALGLILVLWSAYAIGRRDGPTDGRYRRLLLPFLIMAFLSLGRVYRPINALGVPLLSSQRVSTRFLVFPLLGLLFLGSENLQRLIERQRPSWRWQLGGLILAGALFHDLWQHTKLWRVRRMMELFDHLPIDFSGEVVANHPDPAYTAALIIGVGVALLSLIFLLIKVRRSAASSAGGPDDPWLP